MRCKVTVDTSHYGKARPWALPEGWCWTTLKEVCSIRGGKRIPKGKSFSKEKTAHVYIRVTDMKNMTVDMNDLKYIDDDVYGEISRYIIEKDDLYLTIAGTIGKVGEIPEELHGMNLTENAARLTDIACDKLYLMYALQTDVVQSHFSMRFHQVAQPKLSIETASSTLIALPPLFEQKRIVSAIQTLLTCIDSIEVEQHELDTNVENAKERILDLAIHGKLVSQDPSDEPAIELLKRINPDFAPSHNLHYEGEQPNGWCIITFGEVAEYINGRAFKPEEWEKEGLPIIRIQNLNDTSAQYNRTSGSYEERYLIHHGDILFAWAASLNAYIWDGNDAWLNQHIFKIIPKECVLPKYLYYTLKAKIHDFYQRSHGSGMVHITRNTFLKEEFLLPPLKEQERIIVAIEKVYSAMDLLTSHLTT